MIPTRFLRNRALELLADDVTSFAITAPNLMALYSNNVTPSENSTISDFTPATFAGSAPIAITSGNQPEGFNPTTGDSVMDLSPPVGGFRWECTGTPGAPETIFGFYVTDAAAATLLCAEKFAAPITVTLIHDVIDVGDARLTLAANSIQ